MKRKKNLELAAMLLSNSYGYVGGNHSEKGAFDFRVVNDGVIVFNAFDEEDTFYWPEIAVHIADALDLLTYVYVKEIEKGKKRVVMRIH